MMTRLTAADGHELDCWMEPAKGERRGGLVILQEIFGVTFRPAQGRRQPLRRPRL